jgi:hypothetical protein
MMGNMNNKTVTYDNFNASAMADVLGSLFSSPYDVYAGFSNLISRAPAAAAMGYPELGLGVNLLSRNMVIRLFLQSILSMKAAATIRSPVILAGI